MYRIRSERIISYLPKFAIRNSSLSLSLFLSHVIDFSNFTLLPSALNVALFVAAFPIDSESKLISFSLSPYLSVCLFIYLCVSVYISVFVSVSLLLCLSLSICVFGSLPSALPFLYLSLFAYLTYIFCLFILYRLFCIYIWFYL